MKFKKSQNRRDALKTILFSSAAVAAAPLLKSCETAVDQSQNVTYKTELDKAISEISSHSVELDENGLAKIPAPFVTAVMDKHYFVLTSEFHTDEYSLLMKRISIEKNSNEFYWTKDIAAHTTILDNPENVIIKLNDLDHDGLRERFTK